MAASDMDEEVQRAIELLSQRKKLRKQAVDDLDTELEALIDEDRNLNQDIKERTERIQKLAALFQTDPESQVQDLDSIETLVAEIKALRIEREHLLHRIKQREQQREEQRISWEAFQARLHKLGGTASRAPSILPFPSIEQIGASRSEVAQRQEQGGAEEEGDDNDEDEEEEVISERMTLRSRTEAALKTPPVATRLRKRPQDQPFSAEQAKRAKKSSNTQEAGKALTRDKPRRKRPTIEFDDLYQGKDKHKIVEYGGDWYILYCQKHQKLFHCQRPIKGAIRHGGTLLHGAKVWNAAQAITEFGIRVLNCSAAKREKNNTAFFSCYTRDPKKLNTPVSQTDEGMSNEVTPTMIKDPVGQSQRADPHTGVADPAAGELYLGCRDGVWHAIVLLSPAGDFAKLGFLGSIRDTALGQNALPACYDYDKSSGEVRGWSKDFEDGMPMARWRQYPALLFFDDQVIPSRPLSELLPIPASCLLAWVFGDNIVPFGRSAPGTGERCQGYEAAVDYRYRMARIQQQKQSAKTYPAEQNEESDSDSVQASIEVIGSDDSGDEASDASPAGTPEGSTEDRATSVVGAEFWSDTDYVSDNGSGHDQSLIYDDGLGPNDRSSPDDSLHLQSALEQSAGGGPNSEMNQGEGEQIRIDIIDKSSDPSELSSMELKAKEKQDERPVAAHREIQRAVADKAASRPPITPLRPPQTTSLTLGLRVSGPDDESELPSNDALVEYAVGEYDRSVSMSLDFEPHESIPPTTPEYRDAEEPNPRKEVELGHHPLLNGQSEKRPQSPTVSAPPAAVSRAASIDNEALAFHAIAALSQATTATLQMGSGQFAVQNSRPATGSQFFHPRSAIPLSDILETGSSQTSQRLPLGPQQWTTGTAAAFPETRYHGLDGSRCPPAPTDMSQERHKIRSESEMRRERIRAVFSDKRPHRGGYSSSYSGARGGR